jgi:hypothetical protein
MSSFNSVINVSILSALSGLIASNYPYDAPWLAYLSTPASDLKSKVIIQFLLIPIQVVASVRNNAAKHYAHIHSVYPSQVDYLAIFLSVVLILSTIGLIVKKRNVFANTLTMFTFIAGIAVHFVVSLPNIKKVGARTRPGPITEADCLRNVAMGHAILAGACLFGLMLQMVCTLFINFQGNIGVSGC